MEVAIKKPKINTKLLKPVKIKNIKIKKEKPKKLLKPVKGPKNVKPRTKKMYFTTDTEDAIIKFNNSSDQSERDMLFEKHIYPALDKLCEILINKFKFFNAGTNFDETKLEYAFGNAAKLSSAKAHVDTSKIIESVSEILNPKNIKIAQREAIMWGTHQQEAIEYGNLIHEILSFVKTKDDVDFALINALENGLITNNQKEMVAKTIREIVNHSELKNYFDKDSLVLNEQTIIQKEGNLVKPDRMVISNKNEVYLLDYKTGLHQPKYKQQLENYQTAIEKMGYKVNKKALIYIGEKIEVLHL
jgi:large-conductance mechanosensitive channel